MKPKPFSSLNHLTVPRKRVPSFRATFGGVATPLSVFRGAVSVVPEVEQLLRYRLAGTSQPSTRSLPEAPWAT